MQIIRSPRVYPVIVIGSGAAGGMAAWNLTQQGVEVCLLDAGTKFDRTKFWTHVTPYEARARRARGERPEEFLLSEQEQPVIRPEGRPFELWRVWGHGGKTNIWGRVSLRYGDLDFEGPAKDGWETPWPFRYADIAPYYDKVDQLIGVCGGDDDQEALPGSKYHLPPPAPRCGERLLQKAAASCGIRIVSGRRANMTRSVRGFAQCHYCDGCGRGCDTASFFCSADHLLPAAMATKKLEIRSNAVAARLLVDDSGRASGVQYFDRVSGREQEVRGKVVVVAASCIDSTRLLLNSTSERFPNGIGNGNDVIGRHLCEQFRFHVRGFLPTLYGQPWQSDRGIGEHIYLPRFNQHPEHKRDYLRGFGMQFWNTGRSSSGVDHYARTMPGFGADLKREITKRYPAWFEVHPYGEVLPYAHNRVTVDRSRTDRYGVPLAKIDYQIGENERRMREHMYDVVEEICHAAKAELVNYTRGELDVNGSAIHEHGTCRMGTDPKRTALNAFNQMHEVNNVFVVDGSSFPTATEKNPTLTILAVAWRASDYLADQIRQGHL